MLIYVLLSVLAGWLSALFMVHYGYMLGLIDKPNHRSSHSVDTPKGGGLGILLVFLTSAISTGSGWALWMPTLILSLLSLYGDKFYLSHKLRLVVQLICASLFICFAAENNYCDISVSTGIPAFIIVPVFVLMITATANYYNFMDGINGIAGITGVIAFLCFASIAHDMEMAAISIICLTIAGACIGFLILNMSGKVFMGDGGSILLGFLFAGIAILLSNTLLDVFCYFAFIFPFYADELITIIVRLKKRQNLFKPHRGHLCQLLANELKISHWKISFSYALFQTVIIFSVEKIREYGLVWIVAIEIVFLLIFLLCYMITVNIIKKSNIIEK
jgi:Fuc2NAc and GlcNAc transferase